MKTLEPCLWCKGEFPRLDGPTHEYVQSTPGCWASYGRVLVREYENRRLMAVHRLADVEMAADAEAHERLVRTVPGVKQAVKWNSPMYGVEGRGWFVSFHTFTNFVKVTFFMGRLLEPAPGGGTAKDARWIDVHEHDLDEAQLKRWIRQAATLPGWGTS